MKFRLHHRPSLFPALVLAALVAACGGSPSASAPANTGASSQQAANSTGPGGGAATSAPGGPGVGTPGGPASVAEPCTLLTEAEIKRATGFPIKWTFPNEAGADHPVGCNWSLGTAELGADIVIGVWSPGGAAHFDPSLGDPVDGIGDRAYQSEDAVVDAVKGETFVSVTYIASEGDHPEITRELARLIMEKV